MCLNMNMGTRNVGTSTVFDPSKKHLKSILPSRKVVALSRAVFRINGKKV